MDIEVGIGDPRGVEGGSESLAVAAGGAAVDEDAAGSLAQPAKARTTRRSAKPDTPIRLKTRSFILRLCHQLSKSRFPRATVLPRRKTMKIARTLALLALVVVFAAACSKSSDDEGRVKEAQTLANQAYGSDPLQVADVYIPKGGGDGNGVVILIHGGSWIAGDKGDFQSYPSLISQQGYVLVNMNYRLADAAKVLDPTSNTITIAKMLDDIDSVKTYIAANADDWDCDPDRIALVGASAGAHLSLMDTLTRNGSGTIKACVSFSGPTDFTESAFQGNSFSYGGSTYTVLQGLELAVATVWVGGGSNTAFDNASPIKQDLSQAASAKFLLVHGQDDTLVPYTQAQAMKDKLAAGDISTEWYLSPTDDHDLANCLASVITGKVIPLLQATLK
jgi:acetyl esterase/lipase